MRDLGLGAGLGARGAGAGAPPGTGEWLGDGGEVGAAGPAL